MIKNKIVVGILPTYDYSSTSPYKDIDRFIRMYEEVIVSCDAIPIGLLNKNINIYSSLCDAYIWPGGSVINKEFYKIFDDIFENNKPLLGICLGAQAISTYFNILDDQKKEPSLSLLDIYNTNDLDEIYLKHLAGDSLNLHNNSIFKDDSSISNAKHEIKLKKNSFMYDIYGVNKLNVVSLHGYAINKVSSSLMVSAMSNDNVIEAIEYHKNNSHILGLQYHPEVIKDYKPFLWLIDNAYNKYKLLVNKNHKIPDNLDFTIVNYISNYPNILCDETCIEEQASYAFNKLKKKMLELGYNIDLESGYRTHLSQEKLFNDIILLKGIDHTSKYVARPYHSEHELGLALDVCCEIDGIWYNENAIELKNFYQELHKRIADYGFILRYPKSKEKITGYSYEPWHLRYVGSIKFAKKIMDNNLCLEEVSNLI